MRVAVLALVLTAAPAWGQLEITPRVGFDFEHFGESYQISDDQDTVSTINDVGTLIGLTVQSPLLNDDRFRLDADVHVGKETRRFRLDLEGRARRGDHTVELEHEGIYRIFKDGGDYSIAGNYLQDYARITYERRVGDRFRFRLRDTFDVTWYEQPNEYNLNAWLHRPGADLRMDLGDLSELALGYQLGRRSVPDSTSLEYWRHTGDANVSLLFGWSASLDIAAQLERRIYEPGSVRESSWEGRADLLFEFGAGDRATFRLLHENEIVRYDTPDDLDFDSNWVRTGFQVEVHSSPNVDLSLMPVYAYLTSSTSPAEEYNETGLELGLDWRIGRSTWINVSHEIGRRDYEISASDSLVVELSASLEDELLADSAFSDYIYNRLTLLVTSDVSRGVSVNLFANWQPEDHRVNRHDTDSRIVSGGVEYRF